jgi:alpha-beta hydrolase superfamily lysophospholipase
MGSFLVRTFLIRRQGILRGALLCGTGAFAPPLLAVGVAYADRAIRKHGPRHRSKRMMALCFGTYNNAFMPAHSLEDWLTRDTALLEAHRRDPMCRFIPTLSMFRDMFGGLQYIGNPAHMRQMQLDLPVYFFSGEADPVGQHGAGVRRTAAAFMEAGCQDISLRLYPGGRHEILNELNRDAVYDDTLRWLESKL